VVPIDNMGSVHFSPQRSNTRHFIEQIQLGRLWAEEDTGVTALVQGRSSEIAESQAQKTLGGLALQLQQSQKGFKKQVHHLARQLRQVLKLYLGLWAGHVAPTVSIHVPDTDGLQARLLEGGAVQQAKMVQVGPQQLHGAFDIVVRVNPEAYLEQQKLLVTAEKLDAIVAPIWPLGRRELWKHVWETLGLQEFDRFYPESVATVETLLLVLRAQLQLASLQGMLMQAGQHPGMLPGMDSSGQNPFASLFGGQSLGDGAPSAAMPLPGTDQPTGLGTGMEAFGL
jgi:hypothetical protein